MNDSEVARYLESRDECYSRRDLAAYVLKAWRDGAQYLFGIYLRVGGDHIGNVKLCVDGYHRRADIGLVLDRAAWGRGYGTEAFALVSEWGLRYFGLRKVWAGVYRSNAGSLSALQRAGFRMEGALAEHATLDGRPEDVMLLARFLSDLSSTRGFHMERPDAR